MTDKPPIRSGSSVEAELKPGENARSQKRLSVNQNQESSRVTFSKGDTLKVGTCPKN